MGVSLSMRSAADDGRLTLRSWRGVNAGEYTLSVGDLSLEALDDSVELVSDLDVLFHGRLEGVEQGWVDHSFHAGRR